MRRGLQVVGFFNWNRNTAGVQIAAQLKRSGGDVIGVQPDLVNRADRVMGVQIGLVNIIQEGAISVLPLFNASLSI